MLAECGMTKPNLQNTNFHAPAPSLHSNKCTFFTVMGDMKFWALQVLGLH